MKTVAEILQEFEVDFAATSHEGGSIVLMMFPYRPFEKFPKGHLFLDNYYVEYQKMYYTVRDILHALQNEGIEARIYREEFLKPLAVRMGCAVRGKNDLVYNKKYGSYFILRAIFVGAEVCADALTEEDCGTCDSCIRACPNGALSEKGFDRARCLRQFMDKRHNPTEEEKMLIGDRLMGCIECRQACPKNAHIMPLPIPSEILAATKKDALDLPKIKELIGDNLFKK